MKIRILTSSIVLMLFSIAAYHLSVRFMSQLHFVQGTKNLREGFYGLAVIAFQKALGCAEGDYLAWNALARANHELSCLKPPREAFPVSKRARQAYTRAAQLNPHDAEAAYGLAREEARLQQLYGTLHPDEDNTPYDPLPSYEEALRLRPNSIGYHYAFARYLHNRGDTSSLLPVVTKLVRLYPPAYTHLTKEAFYSPEVKQAVRHGLQQAVQQQASSKVAHLALSSLFAEEHDWYEAIAHYQRAMALDEKGQGVPGNYMHLGRLYLENKQFEEADQSFILALSLSQNRERDLEAIYRFYAGRNDYENLYQFYERAKTRFALSARVDILLAKSLIGLERHHEARAILKDVNQKEPNAEAYYWLFRMALKENDLDEMELAIQKATVIERKNSQYHHLFSQVLNRVNKLERAEKEADLAIDYAAKPSVGLFNHRASIRWKRKDNKGAAEDWKAASTLEPRNASLHARTAEAYVNLGDKSNATKHYRKAAELDPNNKQYQEKYAALAGYR